MLALTPEETTQKAGKHACPLAAPPLKPSILQADPQSCLHLSAALPFVSSPLNHRLAPLTTDGRRLVDFARLTRPDPTLPDSTRPDPTRPDPTRPDLG